MELNETQKSVVNELDDNILLMASAGTGKTSTLAYRIANIINTQKAKSEEILCLTFTNRACIEIKNKIEIIAGKKARDVVVKTFHSFCCDIVRMTAKKTSDLFTDFIIFDEEDCRNFIAANPKVNPNTTVAIQKFIKLLKESMGLLDLFSVDKFDNYQRAIDYMYANEQLRLNNYFAGNRYLLDRLKNFGAEIISDYNYRLNEAHGLDFDDLIIYANEALMKPEIQSMWQERFKFINIDEVQDTNKLEYKIISKIFGSSKLLLCGDPFQTIYEWRGSDPKLVREQYKKDYHPHVIVLNENYRATQTLLGASYKYLKGKFYDEVSKIYEDDIKVASPEIGEKIVLHKAKSVYQEAQWIYNQIKLLHIEDLTRICVLTRNNSYNKQLAKIFSDINNYAKKKIPFMLIEEFNFFRRQEIKDILAFMRFAINKHDGMSLERVIKRFSRGIGGSTIDSINTIECRKAGVRLTDFMDPSTHRYGDPFEELLQALENENVVVFDVETTGLDTVTDEIIQIAAIRLNSNGSIKDKFMRYVKPTKSVGRSVNIHRLTDEFLAMNGNDAREVFNDFVNFAEDTVLVGHNVNYDLSILSSQMNRLSMPSLKYRNYYDTLDIFRRFYPNLKNHKLEFLGEFCNISHKSTHDAFDDICATAEILMYALENKILPMLRQRRWFINKYLNKFNNAVKLMANIREKVNVLRPKDLMFEIIKIFKIKEYYEQRSEGKRVKYLRSLYALIDELDDGSISARDATQQLLQYTTLSNTELFLKNDTKIPVITVHQAKGMEFDYVFIAGLMEKTFPSFQSVRDDRFEEEARLFYVAITRAKKKLFLSFNGNQMSRFISDIPMSAIQNV